MPCHYQIVPAANLVIKTYTRRVTFRCVLGLLDALEADPEFREGMLELDDLRFATDVAITASDLQKFADLLKGESARSRSPVRKAVIAPSGPARIAAHGFHKEVEDVPNLEFGIVDNLHEALEFLGLSSDLSAPGPEPVRAPSHSTLH